MPNGRTAVALIAVLVVAGLMSPIAPAGARTAACGQGVNGEPWALNVGPGHGAAPLTVTMPMREGNWPFDADPFRWGPPLFDLTVTVDWGDGSSEGLTSDVCPDPTITPGYAVRHWDARDLTHTYDAPGQYFVRIGYQAGTPEPGWVFVGSVVVTEDTPTPTTEPPGTSTTTTSIVPPTTEPPVDPGGEDPPEACAGDAHVPRPPTTRHFAGWTGTFSAAGDDGLVATDVRLGTRSLARRMSLPYLVVRTSRGRTVVELQRDGRSGEAKVRLLDFRPDTRTASGREPAAIVAMASWVVWWPDRGTDSCLEVEQRYELEAPRRREDLPPTEAGWCNPAQSVGIPGTPLLSRRFRCARFYPTVEYDFHGDGGETLTSIEAPQRLHLRPGTPDVERGGTGNSSGVFQDCDTRQRRPNEAAKVRAIAECLFASRPPRQPTHPIILTSDNPVEREFTALVVRPDRRPGRWDNYHCSLGDRVQAPGADASFPIDSWGCPTCVHIHWRWGTIANYSLDRPLSPRYTSGVAMVASDRQTVRIAATTASASSLDPVAGGWQALVDGEPVRRRDQVLWYVGQSSAPSDRFFEHGGFFADL